MLYKNKYLKYKEKYLNLKNLQTGGNKDYSKTIVLSCKEFDHVVDNLIALDAVKNNLIKLGDKTLQNFEQIKLLDAQIDTIDNNNIVFNDFLDEIDGKIKLDDLIKKEKEKIIDTESVGGKKSDEEIISLATEKAIQYRNKVIVDNKYKQTYMRKLNNYETTNFFRGFINWKTYPDNTPDIKMNFNTVSKLKGAKVIYFAYFSFDEKNVTSIIDQFLFLNSLSHYGVGEINIVLPYFPVGTMERIVGEGEIPTGYSLAHMLNTIPNGTTKNKIYIFDIHALCSRFFFQGNIIPILITMMSKYTKYINDTYKNPDDLNIIVFPDDGAKKRYDKLVPPEFKKILCNKIRDGHKRIIKIVEGDENLKVPNTTNVVDKNINLFLIDDLVQSGSTIIEAFKGIHNQLCLLGNYNPTKVKFIPIITHSIFPKSEQVDDFFKEITINNTVGSCTKFSINNLITTNSRPEKVNEIQQRFFDKITIIDIAESFYEVYVGDGNELNGPYALR